MKLLSGIFQRHKKKNTRIKWIPEITKQELYDELMLYIQDHGREIVSIAKEPWTLSTSIRC